MAWVTPVSTPRQRTTRHRLAKGRTHRRAAVIHRSGATPSLDQFADPQPGQGVSVGTLVAAALNPLDVAIANDQVPFRRLQPPYVAGYEAVVRHGDGTRCYLTGPPAPYGTLAELVPVPDSAAFPVPAGIDPGLAAALGTAGLAGWVALDYRGHLQPGETVLILGAGGSAGQLAVNPPGSWARAGSSAPPRQRPEQPLTAGPTRSSTSRMTRPSTPPGRRGARRLRRDRRLPVGRGWPPMR